MSNYTMMTNNTTEFDTSCNNVVPSQRTILIFSTILLSISVLAGIGELISFPNIGKKTAENFQDRKTVTKKSLTLLNLCIT